MSVTAQSNYLDHDKCSDDTVVIFHVGVPLQLSFTDQCIQGGRHCMVGCCWRRIHARFSRQLRQCFCDERSRVSTSVA